MLDAVEKREDSTERISEQEAKRRRSESCGWSCMKCFASNVWFLGSKGKEESHPSSPTVRIKKFKRHKQKKNISIFHHRSRVVSNPPESHSPRATSPPCSISPRVKVSRSAFVFRGPFSRTLAFAPVSKSLSTEKGGWNKCIRAKFVFDGGA